MRYLRCVELLPSLVKLSCGENGVSAEASGMVLTALNKAMRGGCGRLREVEVSQQRGREVLLV